MTGIPLLDENEVYFPHPSHALVEPDGLLAAGGALSQDWLLTAYSQGIFPWFEEDPQPEQLNLSLAQRIRYGGPEILWWSPSERAGLKPGQMKISRSLAKRIRNAGFEVKLDTQFAQVVAACAGPRPHPGEVYRAKLEGTTQPINAVLASGTWITPNMQRAYTQLHEAGYAHSVEVYFEDELVGGLYGVSLGRMFFGESMFSRAPDASKIALYQLQHLLKAWQFTWIDCQMQNPHLAKLGVTTCPREDFLTMLDENQQFASRTGPWRLPGH